MEMRRARRLAAGVVLATAVAGVVAIAVGRGGSDTIAVDRSVPGAVTSGAPPCGPNLATDEVDPSAPAPTSAAGQQLQARLDAVAQQVEALTAGWNGYADVALWQDAGAILLQWKAPVPDRVTALADRDWANGVRVVVHAVPYSMSELLRAQSRADETTWTAYQISLTAPCGDDSGLEVGIDPQHWPADPAAVRDRLTALVGVPVALEKDSVSVAVGQATGGGASG